MATKEKLILNFIDAFQQKFFFANSQQFQWWTPFPSVSLIGSILIRPINGLNSHKFQWWAESPEAMEVVAGEDEEPLFPPVGG